MRRGILRPPLHPAPHGGGGIAGRSEILGISLLCIGVPVLRDLVIRQRPSAAALVAAIAYLGLLAASVITMRAVGISVANAGIRSLNWRALVIGGVAGGLLVAPVWHVPPLTAASASWLLLAVVVEEVAFRGVLFAILRRLGGLPLAVVGSTAAFTLAHIGRAGWPSLALVALAGLFLGLLRAMRDDLWAPGIAHFLMDLVSLP